MKKLFLVSWLVSICGILLAACATSKPLPCPISQESMENPEADFVAFTVQNNACITFCDVNIAPTTCDNWGLDWLKNGSLRTGESLTAYLPAGKYDVLLEDCTDLSYHFYKQKVDGNNELIVRDAGAKKNDTCQASLTVVNNTAVPVCHMWIAAEHSESFGGNWLGSNQIAPDESAQFFVFPGTYDLKAEDCDFNLLRLEMDTEIEEHLTWNVD